MDFDVLEVLRKMGGLLSGHFVLKSGRHSGQYLAKDVLYPHTSVMEMLGLALADLSREAGISGVQLVAGPEKGGIILAQWTAYAMRRQVNDDKPPPKAIYAEKATGPEGGFFFSRGYAEMIPGKRVLLVEDIVTTGGSIGAVAGEVTRLGGTVVGIVALVNRGGVKLPDLHTLASLDIESWLPEDCPLCKQNVPLDTKVGHGHKKHEAARQDLNVADYAAVARSFAWVVNQSVVSAGQQPGQRAKYAAMASLAGTIVENLNVLTTLLEELPPEDRVPFEATLPPGRNEAVSRLFENYRHSFSERNT